jgi:acetyl esterase/lipase
MLRERSPLPFAPEGCSARRRLLAGLAAGTLAACDRAAFLAANVPAAFGAYHRRTDVSYGEASAHRLDVYVPTASVARPRPLVVFWHGGRWTFGDKAQYRFVGAALAEIGCIAVLPNYRHYPAVHLAGFMDDAARAALWAAENAAALGADPGRLHLMGHSAGAHLAALVTLDTRYFEARGGVPPIAGLIGLSGPYDFLPLREDDVKDMFGPPARYGESQPIEFVRAGAPPALLIHGLRDETVWPKNTRNLATALAARGVPVRLELYPGCGHADTVAALSSVARGRAPTLAQVAQFIDRG